MDQWKIVGAFQVLFKTPVVEGDVKEQDLRFGCKHYGPGV